MSTTAVTSTHTSSSDYITTRRNSPHRTIEWTNNPIHRVVFDCVGMYVAKSRDYSTMRPKDALDFINHVRECVSDYDQDSGGESGDESGIPAPTFEQLMSLHHVLTKAKIVHNYNRMNANIDRFVREYDSIIDILDIARRYDFPPLNLLRGIFLHKGMSGATIHALFKDGQRGKSLSQRDWEQYRRAVCNDAENNIDQQKIAADAQTNEDLFVGWFKSKGIDLFTQAELVADDIAKYGRAVCTPDIVFKQPITIVLDGIVHTIKWIDFKSYVGAKTNPMASKNREQAAKYYAKWGLGALCFQQAHIEGLSFIPYCIILDGTFLKDMPWV